MELGLKIDILLAEKMVIYHIILALLNLNFQGELYANYLNVILAIYDKCLLSQYLVCQQSNIIYQQSCLSSDV